VSELDEIFERHESDKLRNGYSGMYQRIFNPIRKRAPLRILEIGAGTSRRSLRAFRDYCPNATFLGLDIDPSARFTEERIETGTCDSTDALGVSRFFAWRRDGWFDLIIDDGDHFEDAQVATFVNFHRKVRKGGIYVIEGIEREDSYVFHFWEAIAGWRFRPFDRRPNALALERV